jgi:hypothetical protein
MTPRYLLLFAALPVVTLSPTPAAAQFVKTGEIVIGPGGSGSYLGLAFGGGQWHVADVEAGFRTYTPGFDYLSQTAVPGANSARGLAFDPGTGHLFLSDTAGVVREVTVGGSVVGQFAAGTPLNAVAYDPGSDTLWLAYYTGGIEHRTRAGGVLGSFNGVRQWTGLALDGGRGTLLAMEDGDTVYEFRPDGTPLGAVVTTDQIPDNGFGLAYDAALGRLYATGQFGPVVVFDDPARVVPEPATVGLIAAAALGLVGAARRRVRARG